MDLNVTDEPELQRFDSDEAAADAFFELVASAERIALPPSTNMTAFGPAGQRKPVMQIGLIIHLASGETCLVPRDQVALLRRDPRWDQLQVNSLFASSPEA